MARDQDTGFEPSQVLLEEDQGEVSWKVSTSSTRGLQFEQIVADRWFVYNLSPSFNWSSHGFSGESRQSDCRRMVKFTLHVDTDLKNFVWDLGKEGYVDISRITRDQSKFKSSIRFVLQLISLAGLHLNATAACKFTQFKVDFT